MSLPLLEDIIIGEMQVDNENNQLASIQPSIDLNKDNKSPPANKKKQLSPYDAEDEFVKEQKLNIKNVSFKTERVPWAKVIQFPEEALIVESREQNLFLIRDTFRTTVNVKVIYLKVISYRLC